MVVDGVFEIGIKYVCVGWGGGGVRAHALACVRVCGRVCIGAQSDKADTEVHLRFSGKCQYCIIILLYTNLNTEG